MIRQCLRTRPSVPHRLSSRADAVLAAIATSSRRRGVMHKLARYASLGALLVVGFLLAVALLSIGLLSWTSLRERTDRGSNRNGPEEAAYAHRTPAVL